MKESHIVDAIQDLEETRVTDEVATLCQAMLDGDNTENNEAVIVVARRIRRDMYSKSKSTQ